MEKYFTISDAAKILKVNPETLRRWDKSGKFSSTRHPVNNYRVYTENQLISLVEELQLEIPYAQKRIDKKYTARPKNRIWNTV